MRRAEVKRETGETKIAVALDLDGTGRADITTGIGFLDHMLTLLARHSMVDLLVRAEGDLHVDDHHTTEDVGIALGQALRQALGAKIGIRRYADCLMPMDETLARVALDISGRAFLVFKANSRARRSAPSIQNSCASSSRLRGQCAGDAPRRSALWREQPPYRGSALQGACPRAAPRHRNRCAREGCRAFHQGDPFGLMRLV